MSASSLRADAVLNAYLTEYEQCMESYRHTYQTIWQVGSIFAAIGGAMFAFGDNAGKLSWTQTFAPLPLLFWYLGVFLPMDRYGDVRRARLVWIESAINREWGLSLSHYRDLQTLETKRKVSMGRWTLTLPPRVRLAVHLLSLGFFGIMICLVIKLS